ncbi:MAG: hypothetical protein LR015_14810 [Verrucomicrobia bacterium]|nr:hypothetical protein [Verrucomicrobiota bacterium]
MLLALEQFLYSDKYGPTCIKLADYLGDLFANGLAYIDDISRGEGTLTEPLAR